MKNYGSFCFCFAVILLMTTGVVTAQIKKPANPNGRNDSWGYSGYGGGGAMFYPAVSPHNPNRVFVSCDMTGSFSTTNGGESWRMFNLRNHIDFYVFDPLDSNVVYARSLGLFKSTDRGNTWSLIYPASSNVVGIVSKDDHASEVLVTRDSSRSRVGALAVDPDDSQKLYASIDVNKKSAFFSSIDGGGSWMKIKDLPESVTNIFVVPGVNNTDRTLLFAGHSSITVREKGIWTTNKGPEKVNKLTSFTGGYDFKQKRFSVYAIAGKSYFDNAGTGSGIFITNDFGKTWENREGGLTRFVSKGLPLPEWRAIGTSSSHPNVVYVSYDNLKTHPDTTSIGVAKSVDFGNTWTLPWQDRMFKGGNIPSKNFTDGWINERFGPTWGENPFSLGISAVNPDICYGTDFGRTIKTTDGGATWQQVYTRKKENGGWISRGLNVTCGYSITFDPFDNNHVYNTNTDVGLMESNDGAISWASATKDNGIPDAWDNSTYWIAFDPAVKGRLWATMSATHDLPRPKMWRKNGVKGFRGGIMMTEDGGKSWTTVSNAIGEAAYTHVVVDPTSPKEARVLYACAFGKGVYKSVDGGKTWRQKNNGIDGKEPFTWRITRTDSDGVLFAVVCRRSDDGSIGNVNDGAVYRSGDGAEHWAKVKLPDGTNGPMSIVSDPTDPKILVLSAWGKESKGTFSPDNGGGIFRSIDDGKTWSGVLQKDQHIHDITFDSRNGRYYACGFNGSAYYSEDKAITWKRIKGYNFKWGKRVDPDPRDPEKIFIITFGGGVWYGPAKGDENAVEDILTQAFQR